MGYIYGMFKLGKNEFCYITWNISLTDMSHSFIGHVLVHKILDIKYIKLLNSKGKMMRSTKAQPNHKIVIIVDFMNIKVSEYEK